MNDLIERRKSIPSMSTTDIDRVSDIENVLLEQPQEIVETHHSLHGGVYTRMILLKSGYALTGATIKIPTTLIVSGKLGISVGEKYETLVGTHVLTAMQNRKQFMFAIEDSYVTMLFKTDATTIQEAESEFTDESDRLASRLSTAINHINISGV